MAMDCLAAYFTRILRGKPRPSGRGCRARRTKFALFLPDVFTKNGFNIIGERSVVLLGKIAKLCLEIRDNFHVQYIF